MFYYIDSSTGMLTNVFGAVATFINYGVGNAAPQSMGTPAIAYPLLLEGIATVNCVNYISKDAWRTPSYEFAIQCIPLAPWSSDYSSPDLGANPANVVYDILKRAGVRNEQIDVASFTKAAYHFANPEGAATNGWPTTAINMAITSQETVGDLIGRALENLHAFLAIDNGRFKLKTWVVQFMTVQGSFVDDFSSFSMKPKDVWDMPSEVRAKYLDYTEYSESVVSYYNEPVRHLKGGTPCPITIDLSRFIDFTTAYFYAAYIGQNLANMTWTLNCTCSLRGALMLPGELWYFKNSVLGVEGGFIIKSVTINPIEDGTVEIEAESSALMFTPVPFDPMDSDAPTGNW